MKTCSGAERETAALQARYHLACKEFAPARQIMERLAAESPDLLWVQVILSHVLLQEGRDMAGAEQALRRILALDPDHTE
ncbi:MAG TPA: hypothetical protein VGY58_01825, partial [Gemmataceae bacterium]|nr:hypothetical protein [Gemmataceae bacterium]